MQNIFFEIGLMFILATIGAYTTKLIKQPMIPSYIIAGIIVGPIMHLITNSSTILTLSEIGIAFLLFIVGLEIDFKKLKNVAKVSTIGGITQMFLLFNLGFLIATYFGFKSLEAVYFGIILTFSSTAVVLKILSDKCELDTLHARLIIGFLLIEDIFVVMVLSILNTINEFSIGIMLISIAKGIGAVIICLLAGKYIFPGIFKFAAKTQELLFLVAVSVLFLFSIFFNYIGFSVVIGSFMAGIVLGNLPYHLEIMSKAESLKSFFATLFFVSLGLELSLGSVTTLLIPLIAGVIVIILIKPLITMTICSFFGYNRRPSFLAAISLTQISEFSLIIVSQGLILGHVTKDFFSMTIMLLMTTIITTSYFIKYDHKIFDLIGNKIKFFENVAAKELENVPEKFKPDVIICGYNRIGYSIVKSLGKKKILIVDYNPEIIKNLMRKKNIKCIYGDVGDSDLLKKIPLDNAKLLISTDPDVKDNKLLLKETKLRNNKMIKVVTANQIDEALDLYKNGANYVIMPHLLGGHHVSLMLDKFNHIKNKFKIEKNIHIKDLTERRKQWQQI